MHRSNIINETRINKLRIKSDGTIDNIDTDHIMTHVTGIDFNSLYPSAFSGNAHPFNKYTGGKMYMPGRATWYQLCESKEQKQRAMSVIKAQREMFVVKLKGHIDSNYLNDYINFPPIFRKIGITTSEDTIGSETYSHMKQNGIPVDKVEHKLTMLLSTYAIDQKNGTDYMTFSSYYLWFLIDDCHFIIDDIQEIATFSKHLGFNKFVNGFMHDRQTAMKDKNKGMEQYCKICLNGSYGYDGMNSEYFTKLKFMNKDKTFHCQATNNFVSTRRINDDFYCVNTNPRSYRGDKCLHEAFFTLDNAKYWYLNFVYNFVHKAFDMNRMHFIEGDTDSMYWAISGSPVAGYKQQFDHVIADEKFWADNRYLFFPDPEGGIESEKKLLGLAIEKEAECMEALAPKCYTIYNRDEIDSKKQSLYRLKGVSKQTNSFAPRDYHNLMQDRNVVKGININLHTVHGTMSMTTTTKNALTLAHTKMIVQPNQACFPFVSSRV
jgi:hypothetical protein